MKSNANTSHSHISIQRYYCSYIVEIFPIHDPIVLDDMVYEKKISHNQIRLQKEQACDDWRERGNVIAATSSPATKKN